MNQLDLKGKHGIVTGGARGIGFAIATRLLQSGARVCLWDRDADALKDAQQKPRHSARSPRRRWT